jgi:hypothetical protein|tara:strand:+ start:423 stop:611 length:189 start_codon:yes stop_codon:yes gene_type:complete
MWTLVFVYLYAGTPYAVKYDTYKSMTECFYAREKLGEEQTGNLGYFELGTQAICIHTERKDI